MLLRVTTHAKQMLLRVKDDPVYRATAVSLPAGTYIFRRISNPFNPDWSDWMVLDQSHLSMLKLGADAIVGVTHEHLMFCKSLIPGPDFCGFPSMIIAVEDITPTAVNEEAMVAVDQTPVIKLPRTIIPWPITRYPSFIRHDPPRGNSGKMLIIHDRCKSLHPAARRAC
jgi:hypothetical protein